MKIVIMLLRTTGKKQIHKVYYIKFCLPKGIIFGGGSFGGSFGGSWEILGRLLRALEHNADRLTYDICMKRFKTD